jgi:hypothetical protein
MKKSAIRRLMTGMSFMLCFNSNWVFSQPCSERDENMEAGAKANGDLTEQETAALVLERHKECLLQIPGVVGVGIGLTEEGDRSAIHVYVDMTAGGTAPSAVPKKLDSSVPVRIISTNEIKAR